MNIVFSKSISDKAASCLVKISGIKTKSILYGLKAIKAKKTMDKAKIEDALGMYPDSYDMLPAMKPQKSRKAKKIDLTKL